MCDTFLILKTIYVTSYIDDNTPFAVADGIEDVMRSLEEVGQNLITWFFDNQMKLNPGRCHQHLNTREQTTLKIGSLHKKKFLVRKIIRYKYRLQAKLRKAY